MQSKNRYDAEKCALIAVDEIIDVADGLDYEFGDELKFWKEVKQEIPDYNTTEKLLEMYKKEKGL